MRKYFKILLLGMIIFTMSIINYSYAEGEGEGGEVALTGITLSPSELTYSLNKTESWRRPNCISGTKWGNHT